VNNHETFSYPPWGASFAVAALWSISVEEQFYVLWPQIVRRTSVRGTRIAATVMFAVSTLMPALARAAGFLGKPPVLGDPAWCNTLFRLHPFAVGILIGTIPHRSVAGLGTALRAALVAGGLTLWLLASLYNGGSSPTSVAQATLGYPAIALGAGALLLAALGTGAAYPWLAANPAVVYLGKISYGLYVYHLFGICLAKLVMYPMLRGLGMRWPGVMPALSWPIFVSLSVGLTLGFAMASYRWLESPFLRLKDRFTVVPSRPV